MAHRGRLKRAREHDGEDAKDLFSESRASTPTICRRATSSTPRLLVRHHHAGRADASDAGVSILRTSKS
jgi:hypothetical protein